MPRHVCCANKSGGGEFFSSSAINQYAPSKVIEPIHHDINLIFKGLENKSFIGKVTITFKHNGLALVSNTDELSCITLNAENFEDVQVAGDDLKDYRYDGHHLWIYWQTPFTKHSERLVTIDYTVEKPIGGLYFNKGDEIIGSTPLFAITDHETEKARYWLPTVDFPTVRTTLTWSITAPAQYVSLANGTLTSSETTDGQTTTKWELKHPCPSYLVCFAVGDFIEVDDGEVDGKPIKYYAAKGYKEEDLKRAFDETPAMIQWLQKKVGVPFPWSKYYQIALPPIRGAMENISLVTWIDTFIQDETYSLERKHLTDLVNIHEMGHTYFGDLLVIRHFEHAWLKESWATYIESCWLQDNKSENAFRYEMYENAVGYMKECATKYMRPIVTRKYDSSWDMFDYHTYPGGAWRIHMLRKRLGEEAFWSAVQTYIERFANKTVQTSDFQNCLEEASGFNLTRFFDEWVYGKGYPKLKGQYEYNSNRVKITLTQTQVDEAAQVPLFGFELDVEVVTKAGKKVKTVVSFDQHDTVTAIVDLPENDKPSQVCVDPEGKVLFTLDIPSVDRDILIETAKSSESIVNRIWAYGELISEGSRPALKAVKGLLKEEPYHGVRVEAAGKLAELNSVYSIEILSELLDNEQDPLAIAPIASACTIVDGRLRSSLLRLLEREALPYRAHAAALTALGAQRNPDDLEYLLSVAQDENKIGQHGIIRGGALKALGMHRSEETFKYLLSRVGYNKEPMRSRGFAVQGLANSAQWQNDVLKKQAIEELENLIRDPNQSVRVEAVEALIELKVKSCCNSVEATRSMYSHDDHSWLDRKLRQLQDNDTNDQQTAQKQAIEKLQSRIKSLEDKLTLQEALAKAK